MTDTKPLALVTGASSGIGFELAHQFARNGYDLVLNAEDGSLGSAAEPLQAAGADVQTVEADLSKYDGVEKLYSAVRELPRPVHAAALNAGVGQGGAFLDNDLDKELQVIDLNVRGTVHLAHRLLSDMVARNDGKMLITSSIAAMMPGSYQAVYNATKSFDQSFAEALQQELKDTQITITSLMPGPTSTDFFRRGELNNTPIGQAPKDEASQVAKQGFDALMAGRQKVVASSATTKAMGAMNSVLPDKAKAAAHRMMSKPRG